MRARGLIVILVAGVALALMAPAAGAQTSTAPPVPTTTAPTPTSPTQTQPSPCTITSGGLACPGNPSCVVTSTGVTCANNCTLTSAGLVCPQGQVLANPPVKGGPKKPRPSHQRKGAEVTPPAGEVSPVTTPVVERARAGGRELPFTGGPLVPLLGLGVALLAAGLVLRRLTSAAASPAPATVAEEPRRPSVPSSRVVRSLALATVLLWRSSGR